MNPRIIMISVLLAAITSGATSALCAGCPPLDRVVLHYSCDAGYYNTSHIFDEAGYNNNGSKGSGITVGEAGGALNGHCNGGGPSDANTYINAGTSNLLDFDASDANTSCLLWWMNGTSSRPGTEAPRVMDVATKNVYIEGGSAPDTLATSIDGINMYILPAAPTYEHFTFCYNSASLVLWRNGIKVYNNTNPGDVDSAAPTYFFNRAGKDRSFGEMMDEITIIYNYGLKTSEIVAIYNAESAGYPFRDGWEVEELPMNASVLNVSAWITAGNTVTDSVLEGERFRVRSNVTYLNGSVVPGAECVANISGTLIDVLFNVSAGHHLSQEIFLNVSGLIDVKVSCDLRAQPVFVDHFDNVSAPINTTWWSVGQAGQYSTNDAVMGNALNLSNGWMYHNNPGVGELSAEYWIKKRSGDLLSFGYYSATVSLEWNANNTVVPVGWGSAANNFQLSPNVWHHVLMVPLTNKVVGLWIDDVFMYNMSDAPNDVLFRLHFGQDTFNDVGLIDELIIMNVSRPVVEAEGNTSTPVTVTNVAPVVVMGNVSYAGGTHGLGAPLPTLQYDAGMFVFTYSAQDNEAVNVSAKITNVSGHVLFSTTNAATASVNGSIFRDFSGVPYNFSVSAVDGDGGAAYSQRRFNVTDTVFPVCYGLVDGVGMNGTAYNLSVSCYDESMFSLNVSCSQGFSHYVEGLGLPTYSFSGGVLLSGSAACVFEYCDAHTARDLSVQFRAREINGSVEVQGKSGRTNTLIPLDSDAGVVTERKRDRITYRITYGKKSSEYSFKYLASDRSYYFPSSVYAAWIVDGTARTWFDMNLVDDPGAVVTVEQESREQYHIRVRSTKKVLEFESIGELNCITGSFTLSAQYPSVPGTYLSDPNATMTSLRAGECPKNQPSVTLWIGIVGLACFFVVMGMRYAVFGLFGAAILLVMGMIVSGCSHTVGWALIGASILMAVFFALKS